MSKSKKPVPKPAAKKAAPVSKAKPATKPVAKKPSPAPAKKPAPAAKAKPAPVKKSVPAKPAPKPAAKASVKPVSKPAPVTKTAPAKAAAKAPVSKTPAPAPAKSAAKAAPASKAPVKAAAPAAKPSGKKGPVMNHDVAVRTLTDHRVKHKQEAPHKKPRRSTPLAFSLDDIEEYLKLRAGMKMNLYVPGQDEGKAAPVKVAPKVEVKPVQNRQVSAVSVADLLGFNPFVKKGDISPEEELIPAKFRKYYKLLLELRDHVNEGLATHTEEALKKTGKEDTGDVSAYSQHMADAGTDSFDRDFALSLVNNEQEALYEIAEAIDRMKDGTYGTCEITQKPIPQDRLVAVPFTRYSAEGQRQIEKTRRRGRRTGGNPLLEINEGVGFGTSGGDEGDSEEA